MAEKLEDRCKMLIVQQEYKKCEKKIGRGNASESSFRNPS